MATRLGSALAVGLLVCGCGGSKDGDGNDLQAALNGRTFVSESIEGWQLVPGSEVRLKFHDQKLSGTAGCNTVSGPYTITAGTLSMPGYGMTAMGCDPPLSAQDDWLLAFLRGGPTVELQEPRLVMATPDTRMTLLDREIASPDRPLVGTQWAAAGFSDGAMAGFGSGDATAFFSPDGAVTIDTGCQTGTGTYQVDGTTLTFEAFAYNGAACTNPNYQLLSDQVLLVLDGSPVTFDIEEKRLAIHHGAYTLYFGAGA